MSQVKGHIWLVWSMKDINKLSIWNKYKKSYCRINKLKMMSTNCWRSTKATGNATVCWWYLLMEWHFPDIFYRQDKYLYVSPLENVRNSWLECYRKAYEKISWHWTQHCLLSFVKCFKVLFMRSIYMIIYIYHRCSFHF